MTSQNINTNIISLVDRRDLNDAYYHGVDSPEWQALLSQEYSFMVGNSSKQKAWSPASLSLGQWINGQANGTNSSPEYGFSRHPEAKKKDGQCIVFGTSIGGARTAKAMTEIFALALDVDAGALLDDTIDKLEALGFACIISTTFSHNTKITTLNHGKVLGQLGLNRNPTDKEIHTYLRDHDPHAYTDAFIANSKITNVRKQTVDGDVIEIETPPVEKFRLIFPLKAPIKLNDIGSTQAAALKEFSNKICGLAIDLVGIPFDAACTDPSRLFYTARHPIDQDEWYCGIVRGRGLDWNEIPSRDKNEYVKSLTPLSLSNSRELLTPNGKCLKTWWHDAKGNFMLADLLENECPEKIRGNPKMGFVEVECPHEANHTKQGGNGCFAINSIDSDSENFVWKCQHNACQGHGSLNFIHDALEQGWFDEGFLVDAEYLLPQEDNSTTTSAQKAITSIDKDFTKNTPDSDIKNFFADMLKNDVDKGELNRAIEYVVETTALGKKDVNQIIKKVRADAQTQARNESKVLVVDQADFKEMVIHGETAIISANSFGDRPIVFTFENDIATIHNGQRNMIKKDQFEALVNDQTTWHKISSVGGVDHQREVCVPDKVHKQMFNRDDKPYPELLAVKTTPYFAPDGILIDQEGYHEATKTVLQLNDLEFERVSAQPSSDDVNEAKRLLIGDVFGDFPLDGENNRETLLKRGLENIGKPLPSLAHALALTLQPFVREMINGVTPVFTLTKPAAGTGGGRLVEVSSLIAVGEEAPAQPYPAKEDELSKTITACVNYASEYCFFDNTNLAADSGAFASAITAPKYRARLLGSSRMVDAEIRHTWVMVANNIKGTTEILRRLVMVELDAKVANPENRANWHHADLKGWVRENRGCLVWACLTLIQNWVAKGMQPWSGALKGSFEEWSRVMGGILRDADVRGFLENEGHLRSYASIASDDGVQNFIDHLATEYGTGIAFRPGGVSDIRGHKGKILSLQAELNIADDGMPLAINNWGYNQDDGSYNHSRNIGMNFRDAARKTWQCGDWEVSFREHPDPKSPSQYYWIMTKAIKSDCQAALAA